MVLHGENTVINYNMVLYQSGGLMSSGEGSSIRSIVKERQDALGIPNDPVHPDTMKLTLSPAFLTSDKVAIYRTHLVGEPATTTITKETISIKDNRIWIKFSDLKMVPSLPFVCGFIDHPSSDLQTWRNL